MKSGSLSISHTGEEDINPPLLATTSMMVSLRLGQRDRQTNIHIK